MPALFMPAPQTAIIQTSAAQRVHRLTTLAAISTLFCFAMLLLSPPAHAERIQLPNPVHQQTDQQTLAADLRLPSKGQSMATVLRDYGQPKRQHEPRPKTGSWPKPPITRWDYAAFSVFFENETVVHTVAPQRPPAVRPDR